jgi:hypothetical protein
MEGLRARLEDSLYALVPRLEAGERRLVLELRRTIHGAGNASHAHGAVQLALTRLSATDRQLLVEWLEASATATEQADGAEKAYAEEGPSHVRKRLHQIAQDEDFRRAIATASPDLFARLRQWAPSADAASATKIERSLLSYLMRAAAKTSPFSTLMHHAVLEVDPSSEEVLRDPDPRTRRSRTYLSRSVLLLLWRQALGCCGDLGHAQLSLNPSLRTGGEDRVEGLACTYDVYVHKLWRSERRIAFRIREPIRAGLERLASPFAWKDLLECLANCGMDEPRARTFAGNLLKADVVRLAPPTHGHDPSPEKVYVGPGARDCDTPQAGRVRATVEELTRLAAGAASADAEGRFALGRQAKRVLAESLDDPGNRPLSKDLDIVLEDAFFDDRPARIGRPLTGLLGEITRVVRPLIGLRTSYTRLRDFFVSRFGAGGECADVRTFLQSASAELLSPSSGEWPWWREVVPIDPALAVPFTVFVQFAGSEAKTLSAGKALAVVNQVYTGCGGWVAARYTFGQDLGASRLRDALRQWMRRTADPREPVDVLLSGECSDLQAHAPLTERVLQWPTEPVPDGRVIAVEDTVLRHDPRSGELELRARADDVALAPMYLGAALAGPHMGSVFWLTVIADRFGLAFSGDDWWAPHSDTDVVPQARSVQGRVVLRRAAWWIKTERMRRVWYRRGGASRLGDVLDDCQQYGIPRFVFVRPSLASAAGAADGHKPIWVDMRNPICLELLHGLVKRHDWVRVTEALPDRDGLWTRLGGKRHVSELFFAAVA